MNKLYYSIFARRGYLEYHVSRDRKLAEKGQSLSRRIALSSRHVDRVQAQWLLEAKMLKLIIVPLTVDEALI